MDTAWHVKNNKEKKNQNMFEKLKMGRNKYKRELFYLEVVGNVHLFIPYFLRSFISQTLGSASHSLEGWGWGPWNPIFMAFRVSWIIFLSLFSLSG